MLETIKLGSVLSGIFYVPFISANGVTVAYCQMTYSTVNCDLTPKNKYKKNKYENRYENTIDYVLD